MQKPVLKGELGLPVLALRQDRRRVSRSSVSQVSEFGSLHGNLDIEARCADP